MNRHPSTRVLVGLALAAALGSACGKGGASGPSTPGADSSAGGGSGSGVDAGNGARPGDSGPGGAPSSADGGVNGAVASSSGGSGASSGSGSGGDGGTAASDGGTPGGGEAGLPSAVQVPITDRTKVQLATNWKFMASDTLTGVESVAFDDGGWSSVSVPHTWDSVTAASNGIASHTSSWYRTHFTLTPADLQKRVYVYFEGAFQVADVYVNGQHLGQHRGGYTRFIFDASAAAVMGDNVLAVEVSSGACADCLPDGNTRLFKGYGGIYRKAWLVTTSAYHVATTDYASSGVYVTPSAVSAASATVSAKVLVTNDGAADKSFAVECDVDAPTGAAALTAKGSVMVKAGTTVPVMLTGTVTSPKLWAPGSPNLYSVVATVTVDGTITDAVGEHIGFRSYSVSPSDFTLNGVSTRLRGMSKHQETEYHATAVTDADLVADWDGLQDLGVNFVRLVHYPHAQIEYDLADQRGIMVWAEDGHTNGGNPTPNGDNLCREMVYQNWNHPSIVFWSAGNEASGVAATEEYGSVIKMADPSRPVVYASNGQSPTNVDFIFSNTYAGWYGGTMYDFLAAGDHWVSETGGGMVIGTHTADGFGMTHTADSYEPEEYGSLLNEVRFDDLFRNPTHVSAYAGWVYRDISDVKYKGLLNTKGLLTFAGYKKDVFYHFKSFLQKTPIVHLVGRSYFLRGANATGQGAVKAYSNAASLALSVNGTAQPAMANNLYKHPNGTPIKDVFYWPNALVPGKNDLSVTDGAGTTDTITVYYLGAGTTLPAASGAKVENLTASVGNAFFIDAPIGDQLPFYVDFDGTGDNTFDVVPAQVVGASWIATKRQSDPTKRTDLAFDLPAGADVYVMATKQATAPTWIAGGGFVDTGATGQWRDNTPKLVDYSLYKKTFPAASHVTLATTAIDYVVLVK
jgi:beta-galactosidase